MIRTKYNLELAIIFIFCITPFMGCIGTAKISSFPEHISEIDFENYSNRMANVNTEPWTFETSDEFYFEKAYSSSEYNEYQVISSIETIFKQERYSIQLKDIKNKRIIGRRGLQADEWNSLVGIYYNFNESKNMLQVYIKTEITQDITGGPNKHRSIHMGGLLKRIL